MSEVAHTPVDNWAVTPEKISEAVRRMVEHVNPLQIILFGSRARGTARPDSDLDLAVIVDAPDDATDDEVRRRLPYTVLRGLRMEVTLIVASRAKFDLHRPWPNSIFNYIDREGIVLYDRQSAEPSHPNALATGAGGRVDTGAAAA